MNRNLTAVAERPGAAGCRLSVAQLQQALRAAHTAGRGGADVPDAVALPTPNAATVRPAPPGRRRLVVLGAHPGAGASTVALALSEAVAATGRRAHLVELAPPARSGLVAAATAELGEDNSGRWRRGTRGEVLIDRLLEDPAGDEVRWPEVPASDRETVSVVDLGSCDATLLDGPAWVDAELVVVCRATVPGVRRAEQALSRLRRPAPVAVVGPARWPGAVRASAGARLAERRRGGLVVPVPLDRGLELTGVCGEPLSRRLAASGRALLAVMDAGAAGGVIPGASAP